MRAADAGPLAGAQQAAGTDAAEMPLLTLRRVLPSYVIGIVTTLAVALFAICWGTVHIPPQTTIAHCSSCATPSSRSSASGSRFTTARSSRFGMRPNRLSGTD